MPPTSWKRIAGVKIPKRLRKRGGALYALMDNPMVRNVVADILAVGLLAAADRISKQPKVKKAGRAAKHAAAETADAALHCLTELSAAGNVRTETMRAFDVKEFGRITGN